MSKSPFPKLIQKAISYIEKAHSGQRRKDGFPFIVHPLGTFKLMWDSPWDFTDEEYVSALLHDVIEDCGKTFEEIKREFGEDVAALVWLLSKPEQNGMAREIYFVALRRCSPTVIAIKLADICHNLSSLDVPDRKWAEDFVLKVVKAVCISATKLVKLDLKQKTLDFYGCKWHYINNKDGL